MKNATKLCPPKVKKTTVNQTARSPLSEAKVSETIGTHEISAWRVASDEIRIQVRTPELAQRLKKVAGCKQVGFSVAGGYLRIFAFRKSLRWAKDYIARATSANGTFQTQNEASGAFGQTNKATTARDHRNKPGSKKWPEMEGAV